MLEAVCVTTRIDKLFKKVNAKIISEFNISSRDLTVRISAWSNIWDWTLLRLPSKWYRELDGRYQPNVEFEMWCSMNPNIRRLISRLDISFSLRKWRARKQSKEKSRKQVVFVMDFIMVPYFHSVNELNKEWGPNAKPELCVYLFNSLFDN